MTDNRTQQSVEVEAYDAMNNRKKSRGAANLVEVASDEPFSVDGTVLDPRPAHVKIKLNIVVLVVVDIIFYR